MTITNNNTNDFTIGQRVQLHPALDRWMRGDRYGKVSKVTRQTVHVHLDRSGQTRAFQPMHLTAVN